LGDPVKRAVLVFLIAVGGLYLFRDNLPAGWFSFDYGAAVSTPSSFGKLGQSVGGAVKRSADQF
jgi:hypothetical protein